MGTPYTQVFSISIADYTVTFDKNHADANGWTDASPATMSAAHNATVASLPTNPTRTGYTFNSWNTAPGGNGAAFNTSTRVTGDTTVYAKWTANTYTVSFDSNGGSAVTQINNVNHGSMISAPTPPTKANALACKFADWYKEPSLTNQWTFGSDTVTGDITLYAKWGEYSVGQGGPGGGYIFSKDASGFTFYTSSDGSTSVTRYYLEASSSNLGAAAFSLPNAAAISSIAPNNVPSTGRYIGDGLKNTKLIVENFTSSTCPAAHACYDYRGGGKDDWFLPSEFELIRLMNNRNLSANTFYWSSTLMTGGYAYCEEFFSVGSHTQGNQGNQQTLRVHPIRAF
jgi:uncharacterized repeat protein (TIGR02543 family)